MFGDDCSDALTVDLCQTLQSQSSSCSSQRWISASSSDCSGQQVPHVSDRMFLWSTNTRSEGKGEHRTFYRRICELETQDKKKRVTALRAGEDRAILLGVIMIAFSAMMYFIVGITILRSYSDNLWTEKASCTILNATIMWDVNCSYSCGAECWETSRYPCLQVYVSVSGKVVQLLHNEETQESNSECFYIPKCSKDYSATHTIVQNISDRLRSQHTVDCFVDPTDKMDCAILTQIYGSVTVFHSVLWPTCTLIGGIFIIALVKITQCMFHHV
ncbi:calcium-activated potassium channel subunit beta-2-like isoform X1 [Solea senegalensis]|uniref:Calcium-activated potassium channel subunit beta-2-like isoform X1 n=2 Tax=Solea senegalensis TaxID=28829 RepID=A0AAV6S9A8_SOLSE|nr:calcium-activated potassium channel subunit beta-2-like isoform X1 [Solea senegalensis]KAG7513959.1 calcium-activated potassium channel subunit beta-2-like isoform X1 [Solea senegalensis]